MPILKGLFMMATNKPNVLWILSDQHRAQALGINGDPNLHTPNIDRLASSGVNLDAAVGGFPLCCPFRGSMLTSLYPHKCVPGHEYQLNPEQKTIAHVFNENNYDTCYIGKWHLDGFKERDGRAAMHIIPPERRGGFRHWIGYENNNSQWDCWVHGGQGESAFQYRLPGYETDCLTDLMIDYLGGKAEDQEPFFAVLSVQPPHNPYVAPEEFMKKHTPGEIKFRENVPNIPEVRKNAARDLAGYYAMIENLDYNIGRIIRTLEEKNLMFNTHIVFFSDHGDQHGSHGQTNKTSPYEESIRVPFIISGEKPMNYEGRGCRSYSNIPLNHVDIAPTTLGLCGIETPQWMEGADYSYLRVTTNPKPRYIPDSAYIQSVIPTGHGHSVDKAWRGVVTTDGYKYVCFENMPWLMFDLNRDPYELMDLAHNTIYRNKLVELNNKVKNWVQKTGDDFPVPDIRSIGEEFI